MRANLITTNEAARILGLNPTTLRRWNKSNYFKAIRFSNTGRYYYDKSIVDLYSKDLYSFARDWVDSTNPKAPEKEFYCPDSSIFQTRLQKFEHDVQRIPGLENDFSLITSIVGEIGNNSYDHNLGSWPDVIGILFAYDLVKRQVILADRGQGILNTLKRVRQNLQDDRQALTVAFTEKLSGRSPENRGNGLKYVKDVVISGSVSNPIKLRFETGKAILKLKYGDSDLNITNQKTTFRGCLALIYF